jgi:hypothetical protein
MNGTTLIEYIDPMVAGMAAVHLNTGGGMPTGWDRRGLLLLVREPYRMIAAMRHSEKSIPS